MFFLNIYNMWQDITEQEKNIFNNIVAHPLQSYEWGEFRKKTGVIVVRKGYFEKEKLLEALQLTIHKIPHTNFTIGYLPKGILPTQQTVRELKNIAKKYNCICIQIEPNIFQSDSNKKSILSLGFSPSAHPLFTKYTFQLDLKKSEEELLKNMSQKTRYNIRVAQKHNVSVHEESSKEAFSAYLQLMQETTTRQRFYAHTKNYHTLMWQTLGNAKKQNENELQAHLFIASLDKKPLTTWIIFTFHDMLYYPYGASSSQHREAMSSNLMMWEVIKFGKKLGLKIFDMWGSLSQTPDTKDPWYGFHKFKQGYGPQLVEFVGSYDLITNTPIYLLYKIADKLRWLLLRFRK